MVVETERLKFFLGMKYPCLPRVRIWCGFSGGCTGMEPVGRQDGRGGVGLVSGDVVGEDVRVGGEYEGDRVLGGVVGLDGPGGVGGVCGCWGDMEGGGDTGVEGGWDDVDGARGWRKIGPGGVAVGVGSSVGMVGEVWIVPSEYGKEVSSKTT